MEMFSEDADLSSQRSFIGGLGNVEQDVIFVLLPQELQETQSCTNPLLSPATKQHVHLKTPCSLSLVGPQEWVLLKYAEILSC